MQMKVGESWDDQSITHVFYRNIFIFLWKLGKNTGTEPVFTDSIRIFCKNKFFLILAVTNCTFQSKQIFFHIRPSFLPEARQSKAPG